MNQGEKSMLNTDRRDGAVDKPTTGTSTDKFREGYDRIWSQPTEEANAKEEGKNKEKA